MTGGGGGGGYSHCADRGRLAYHGWNFIPSTSPTKISLVDCSCRHTNEQVFERRFVMHTQQKEHYL